MSELQLSLPHSHVCAWLQTLLIWTWTLSHGQITKPDLGPASPLRTCLVIAGLYRCLYQPCYHTWFLAHLVLQTSWPLLLSDIDMVGRAKGR